MSVAKKPLILSTTVLLLVALVLAILLGRRHRQPDPRLASPELLLREILKPGRPIFLSPEFFPCIPAAQKTLLPTQGEAEAASRDKAAFWKLQREHHYSGVFLGARQAWQPLVDSLLASPLWTLTEVSPWGYLFRPNTREATAWRAPSAQELQREWPHADDRAQFAILTAVNLMAINRLPEAEDLLAMAAATKRRTSLLLSTRASLAASRGQWSEAVALARESLGKDHANQAGNEILIRGLIESGRADEALDRARELFARDEENEETLFLLARAANAAHSSPEEITALARLVAIERKRNQPLGVMLTYLGQAYAKNGQRGEALRTFQQAVVAPELSDEQHKVIRDIMDHLMEGTTSSTTLPPLPPGIPQDATNP